MKYQIDKRDAHQDDLCCHRSWPPYFIFYILYFIFILFSCSEAERLYDSFPTYFVFRGTNTVPQLNAAMGGLGEFCIIQDQGATVLFSNMGGSTPVNKTAVEGYQGFRLGRAGGLIVGQPTLMSDTPGVVCYDLLCPDCYEDNVNRFLQMTSSGMVVCKKCQRTYNLNNLGILEKGEAGKRSRLFRYNCSHHSYTLTINNR
jgi:hypothetical protein